MTTAISLGVVASLGPVRVARIARAAEDAGFRSLWVNDTPGASALDAIAAAASTTSRLCLAAGVLPIDRHSVSSICSAVRSWYLPADRTTIGIGSGQIGRGAVRAVGDAAERLREKLETRVVVGALGPRMRSVGASRGSGVLLSWLTPQAAAVQSAQLHSLSPGTHVALYVRTALDGAALGARDAEGSQYAQYPAYAAHFKRLGIEPGATMIPRSGESPQASLAAFRPHVDEVILRAITADQDVEAYVSFVHAAESLL